MNDRPHRPVRTDSLPFPALNHGDDRSLLTGAVLVAVALHVLVLLVELPETAEPARPPKPEPPNVVRPILPPPPIERHPVPTRQTTRRLPVPDPTPREPEPIAEPRSPSVEPTFIDPETLILAGEPPAPGRPLLPGMPGVTEPVIIPETRVQPDYPETAREARVGADLVLRAIVRRDGTVGEVSVLQCSRPHLGFENAAVEAVRQWRYQPATRDGRPVDVYFTILIRFEMR